MSYSDPDATAIISAILRRYGLEAETEWAWQMVTSGASIAEFEIELRERDTYRTRFRAIFEREAAGLPAISPEDVLEYERRRREVLSAYGLPAGFYDSPDDAVAGLVGDVSIAELEQRASLWADYAEQSYAPAVRDQLQRMFGIGTGSLAAFLMDENKALPLLQRQIATSDVAVRAARAGFDLSAVEAGRVAEVMAPDQAGERFAALADQASVLGDRLGDQASGLTRDDLIGVAAADPNALRAAERRTQRAAASFAGSGGAASTNRGIGGLGTA